jgi:hypothetical protein
MSLRRDAGREKILSGEEETSRRQISERKKYRSEDRPLQERDHHRHSTVQTPAYRKFFAGGLAQMLLFE